MYTCTCTCTLYVCTCVDMYMYMNICMYMYIVHVRCICVDFHVLCVDVHVCMTNSFLPPFLLTPPPPPLLSLSPFLPSSPPPPPPPSLSLQCDASEATWQLIQVVLEENGIEPDPRIMFLGGGCSPATEPLAALSGRFYNVTQVCT